MSTLSVNAISGISTISTSTNTATFGTAAYVVANGNVGIGTSSPLVTAHFSGTALRVDGTNGECGPYLYRAGNNAPDIRFNTSGGTISSPTAVGNGINAGQIHFQSYDGSSYIDGAGVWAIVDGAVSTGVAPTALRFGAGSNSSVSFNERMRITSAGNVGIGTITPQTPLSVVGSIAQQYGTMPFPIQPMLTVPSGKTKVTFSCTGADQSFTVPAGVTAILVKLWGAGGGGGNTGGWGFGARGGGGGHTIGIIPVTPGAVYYIVVGQGGQTNYSGGQTPNYGGGGGMYNNSDNRYAGSGGGYTGIFTSSGIAQGNAVMIAGGGGGGGSSRMRDGSWGGGGGGTTGQQGGSPFENRSSSAGGPGTQSGGGAAGPTQNAQGGGSGALVGGYGASNAYGGGGGGGYFGGGGGGYYESYTMAGGGGGSGYVNTSLVRYGATFTAAMWRPAMFDDQDLPKTYDGYNNWCHYALGGDIVSTGGQYTSTGGGSGFCCIYY